MTVKEIFKEIWLIKDPAGRAKRLDELYEQDAHIAARIKTLLQYSGQFQSILDDPLIYLSSPTTDQAARYSVTNELAKGGMGVVYKAYDFQMRRDVVLKCLQAEHRDNFQAVHRFYNEAHITGQLQHPGIAPVYEVGELEDGRPFYCMKLVEGNTLAQVLADRNSGSVSTTRVLNFFLQVCQTMAFAHERGVIHRDLKPSNIMVGKHGQTLIMDWGLAKSLTATDEIFSLESVNGKHDQVDGTPSVDSGNSNTAKPDLTRHGQVIGTPGYMSPEQALGQNALIDKRSDVYSLGAILCEILTGSVPPAIARSNAQPEEALDDLNQRLSKSKVDFEMAELTRSCLERKPENRPQDADAVAHKMLCYFASREDTAQALQIKLEKELTQNEETRKRRSMMVTCFAACLGILLAGVAGTSIGFYKESVARALADEKAKDAKIAKDLAVDAKNVANELNAKAEFRLEQLKKGNEILGSVFENLHPNQSAESGKPLIDSLVENLDNAAEQLEGNSIGAPDVVAAFQLQIGQCYHALGFDKKSIPLFQKAHSFAKQEYGLESDFARNAQLRLANALSSDHQPDRAMLLYLELQEILSKEEETNEQFFFLLQSSLAANYLHLGNRKKALEVMEAHSERGWEKNGAKYGLRLAEVYVFNQMPEKAIEVLTTMLSETEGKFEFDDRELEVAQMLLGRSYVHSNQPRKAIPILEELFPRLQIRFGNSPNISLYSSSFALGMALQKVGRYRDSIKYLQKSVDLCETNFGGLHKHKTFPCYWLVEAYLKTGEFSKALEMAMSIHNAQVEKHGISHKRACLSAEKIADLYTLMNQPEKAKEYLNLAFAKPGSPIGSDQQLVKRREFKLAIVAANQGALKEAEEKFKEAQELFGDEDDSAANGYPSFFDNLEPLIWHAELLALQGNKDAISLVDEFEFKIKKRFSNLDNFLFSAQQLYRACVVRYIVEPDETLIASLNEVIEILKSERLEGAQSHLLEEARSLQGITYLKLGKTAEAKTLLQSSFSSLKLIRPPNLQTNQATIDAGKRLSHFYRVTNADDAAKRVAESMKTIESNVDHIPSFSRSLIEKTLTSDSK